MDISHSLSGLNLPPKSSCVALGLFNGLHPGHMAVIDRMLALSGQAGLTPLVFTFTASGKHPAAKTSMASLLSSRMMYFLLEQRGVGLIVRPGFEQFCHLTPERFVREMLCERMGAARVVCGEDFRFGKNASGDVGTLRRLCEDAGIAAEAVPTVTVDGQPAATRNIRRLIERGDIPEANRLLGRPFTIDFEVIHGHKLGRKLDLPTINQEFPAGFTLPRFGVYLTRVLVSGKLYSGVTNVGVKPTTGQPRSPLAETFIQDFEGDLYGERVTVEFLQFLRDEQKFENTQQLKAAILADVAHAKEIISRK